ncbi:hypothetical protein C2E23DRAFT_865163 [Lenzites betulinus]|nr:hypothetical protein C2E23DRAFT_865163 [Lenzites betulinus]
MFEFVRAGVQLLFIAGASFVLALTGMIMSVVASLQRTYYKWRGISQLPHPGLEHEPISFPLRDRDHSASRVRKPPLRHRSTDVFRSSSSRRREGGRTPLRASPEPMYPSEERNGGPSTSRPRKHRRKRDTLSPGPALPSIDSALEYVESSSLPLAKSSGMGKEAVRALSSPAEVLSDSSPPHSTDPSIASESMEERAKADRSPSPKRVLQRLKNQHSQFRDRCLTRVHSMPNAKTGKQIRRTDPYQAPYFFPTPLSPDVDIYVEQVRSERQGSKIPDPVSFRQYRGDRASESLRTSPKSEELLLPPTIQESPMQEFAAAPAELKPDTPTRPPLREKSHRWSWHMPHKHGKSQPDESERREDASEKTPLPSPAKFLFGHHRRRNGTASEDLKDKRKSLPSQA